jgi:hypothetical protein
VRWILESAPASNGRDDEPQLPAAPEGTEVSRVEVVIRLRRI